MTALIAIPPVFLHPLADRNGHPGALLFDAGVLDQPDRSDQPPALPDAIVAVLRDVAGGSMSCFYRAGLTDALGKLLDQAGWKKMPAEKLHRADAELISTLPSTVAWVEGEWFLAPPSKPVGSQVASRALALQLVQLVSADADTHEIEALLRQDPTLSYHLLRLVNSLGMGAGRRVTSFSQAILILGRSQLRRWLNLMLFSSREGDQRSPMLLARVAVRARAMELLSRDAGLGKAQQEQAFMVGMFSLLGVLFGLSLPEVLKPLTMSEAVQQALLAHEGELGELLGVVEAAERDDHAALAERLQALQIDTDNFNQVAAEAYLWMQTVASGKAGKPHA
ncbi:HDOD domain-containing protein [Oxalobacteraceae bacterium OTU3REALA1]|nr:HDOD domain-containing protein [Oxalobacteraceae bacterium OTU3REALA1]